MILISSLVCKYTKNDFRKIGTQKLHICSYKFQGQTVTKV